MANTSFQQFPETCKHLQLRSVTRLNRYRMLQSDATKNSRVFTNVLARVSIRVFEGGGFIIRQDVHLNHSAYYFYYWHERCLKDKLLQEERKISHCKAWIWFNDLIKHSFYGTNYFTLLLACFIVHHRVWCLSQTTNSSNTTCYASPEKLTFVVPATRRDTSRRGTSRTCPSRGQVT